MTALLLRTVSSRGQLDPALGDWGGERGQSRCRGTNMLERVNILYPWLINTWEVTIVHWLLGVLWSSRSHTG